jgi:hypothetical protein
MLIQLLSMNDSISLFSYAVAVLFVVFVDVVFVVVDIYLSSIMRHDDTY